MSYFDEFKSRLQSTGANESSSFKNSTVAFINRTFTNSPNYKVVKVNGVDTPSRIINTDTFKEMDMILLPGTIVNVGSLVEFDSLNYLVTDFTKDKIVSKAKLTISVGEIKWYDKDNTLYKYHITGFTASRFQVRNGFNNIGLELATDYVNVNVKRDVITDAIATSQRFIINNKPYQVMGIDNITHSDANGTGLIQLTLSVTTKHPNDDFVNSIADNSLLHEKDSQNSVEGGTGGSLW